MIGQSAHDAATEPSPKPAAEPVTTPDTTQDTPRPTPVEHGGREGLDPVRYGDWEKNGRCIDF
ncbi:DUF1674 domain-containing protein [Aerolutibacter ruishenii]|uniref:Uncharacterized protein DUF1674 n=1 Tax=Aerolutibacter ruishenii TaxID=686800 RepID=A0A562LVM0_9GAMM|nr:DUF1674 domain-containing protein [Lysobacter ruishenii]TWI11685.1 uncharacterized protein DUF1674 [Lysobacter ruishenii]